MHDTHTALVTVTIPQSWSSLIGVGAGRAGLGTPGTWKLYSLDGEMSPKNCLLHNAAFPYSDGNGMFEETWVVKFFSFFDKQRRLSLTDTCWFLAAKVCNNFAIYANSYKCRRICQSIKIRPTNKNTEEPLNPSRKSTVFCHVFPSSQLN